MPPDFAAQRQIMVDSQVRPNDVPTLAIQKAMRSVPREAFCPPDKAYLAYADAEVEYAPGRFMMRPRDVAKLIYATRPAAGERALAIAAPYAAAVLEAMGLSVIRCDPDSAPAGAFDVIVCEGAVSTAPPPAWIDALAPGGRLGVVVRDGRVGRAWLFQRTHDGVGSRAVFDAGPPVMRGFEAKAGFVF
ncbi:MAG TPA: protein-L-isoaspartate O-methyltransferase [Caulobacteraceae bacterium]|nr:protein-L-isoaspartate O-methyltransferase [Caulobacteraceae bacterium]